MANRPTYEEAVQATHEAHKASQHADTLTPNRAYDTADTAENAVRAAQWYGSREASKHAISFHTNILDTHNQQSTPSLLNSKESREAHKAAAAAHWKATLLHANSSGNIGLPYAGLAGKADIGITYSNHKDYSPEGTATREKEFSRTHEPTKLGTEGDIEGALNKHIGFANERVEQAKNNTEDNERLKERYNLSIHNHRKAIAAYSLMKHFPHAAHTDLVEDPTSLGVLADEVEERGDHEAAHHIRALHNEAYGVKSKYGILSDIELKAFETSAGKFPAESDVGPLHDVFEEHGKNSYKEASHQAHSASLEALRQTREIGHTVGIENGNIAVLASDPYQDEGADHKQAHNSHAIAYHSLKEEFPKVAGYHKEAALMHRTAHNLKEHRANLGLKSRDYGVLVG